MRPHATTQVAEAVAGHLDRTWDALMQAWPMALAGDAEGMRRVRVASRRMRTALAVVVTAIAPPDAPRIMRRLRALARRVGPVRDVAVARALVADEIGAHAEDAACLAAVGAELGRRERQAQSALVGSWHRRRLDRRVRAVISDVRASPAAAWAPALEAVLARRLREARAASDACGVLYEPDRLHRLRIALKKLRYALEMAADARWVSPALAAALVAHHRRLGAWHDRVVLEALVREAAARANTAGDPHLARVLARFERDARHWHGRCRRAAPGLSRCLDDIGRALAVAPARGRTMARGRIAGPSRVARRTA